MAELLIEIGFEEMPASWLPGLGEGLASSFASLREKHGLSGDGGSSDVRVMWGPRRLALGAGVSERQADADTLVWGPALKAAKDATGAWTKAADGFAKKNGVAPEALLTRAKDANKPDELNLLFVKAVPGRPAGEVLPELLAALLRSLAFPKRMSWDAWLDDGKGAFPFGRPIRWIVALLDGAVIPFEIFELVNAAKGARLLGSGRATHGHRFLPRGSGGAPADVASFDDLIKRLRERHVLLDPAERAARIDASLQTAGAPAHEIAGEWRDLVEWPTVLVGSVPEEFRSLPVDVLETVLVHHQKYVPIPDGNTIARFAAVTNTDGAAGAAIVAGMERVVVARLRDAAFFWGEDRKRTLADRVADLEGVTFHRELGSYRQKAERLEKLVDAMAAAGVLAKDDVDGAREAARLCKADLTTAMVREFTELQGVMGGLYLEAQGGADADVAAAVRWHYHPVSVEETAAPAGAVAGRAARLFAAVSLADKLDTLAGYFSIGEMPTGSRDPFGLRRAGQGVIRVLLDFWPQGSSPDLRTLVRAALAAYPAPAKPPAMPVAEALDNFLLERLEAVLAARGFAVDVVRAAVGAAEPAALENPREVLLRARALAQVLGEAAADFQSLAVAFKRARNILDKDAPATAVDPKLFDHDAERELHAAVVALGRGAGAYAERLVALRSLRAPVDRFFDQVLVMAEDASVRGNRLALLRETLGLFYRIADLSRLGGIA
ncbi:MAG: glycine--tRNA ligase subunit beta [Vicinamibacteria bacterium]|nr:glycine--tRNA ligase subunit beta [Vicinamibacteria bacterium]